MRGFEIELFRYCSDIMQRREEKRREHDFVRTVEKLK